VTGRGWVAEQLRSGDRRYAVWVNWSRPAGCRGACPAGAASHPCRPGIPPQKPLRPQEAAAWGPRPWEGGEAGAESGISARWAWP